MGIPDAQVGLDDRGLCDCDFQHILLWQTVTASNHKFLTPVSKEGAQLEQGFSFGLLLQLGRARGVWDRGARHG